MKEYIVFDLETSGLNTAQDSIIEIGAIKASGDKILTRFHCLLKPESPISEEVIAVHGITNETLQSQGKDRKEALKNFSRFIGCLPLIAHNGMRFDFPLLANEFSRVNIKLEGNPLIDTFDVADFFLVDPPESYNLGLFCDELGIEYGDLHRAIGDAEATFQLFMKICSSEDIHEMWKEYPMRIFSELLLLPPHLESLSPAIAKQKSILIEYQGTMKPKSKRMIEPRYLVSNNGGHLSLIALCLRDNILKQFRLDRISLIEPSRR